MKLHIFVPSQLWLISNWKRKRKVHNFLQFLAKRLRKCDREIMLPNWTLTYSIYIKWTSQADFIWDRDRYTLRIRQRKIGSGRRRLSKPAQKRLQFATLLLVFFSAVAWPKICPVVAFHASPNTNTLSLCRLSWNEILLRAQLYYSNILKKKLNF